MNAITALKLTRQKLINKRNSESTRLSYLSELKHFFYYFKEMEVDQIELEEIKQYLHLLAKSDISDSKLNLAINSIKYFYEHVLGHDRTYYIIDRPLRKRNLPVVLSPDEYLTIIKNINNLKHRTIISAIYAHGLRISELIDLRIKDIDSKRMQIHIRDSKGGKDRMVGLSVKSLEELRRYYIKYEPKVYMFEGNEGVKYSASSIRKFLHKAVLKTKINKHVTPHTLRHSYATHLLEFGTDLRHIQVLMGHSSTKITERYTHVATGTILSIQSPYDLILSNKFVNCDRMI